jgi:hypothetical protein
VIDQTGYWMQICPSYLKIRTMRSIVIVFAVVVAIAGCNKDKDETPVATIVSASGDITTKVNEFRSLLGNVLNTTPGQTSGRREIDWDGVPDVYSTQRLPSDFFNPVAPGSPAGLQRGFLYAPDTDARISSNDFSDLESTNGTEFSTFSGSKSFSAVSSNLWNVEFEVAGVREAASVKGFGAVFSDVDDATSTTIEYFSGNRSLGVFKVPVRSAGTTLSFLGVYFPDEKVTKVRIRQGNAAVANGVKDVSAGGTKDLVIMDDFLYDEPKALH